MVKTSLLSGERRSSPIRLAAEVDLMRQLAQVSFGAPCGICASAKLTSLAPVTGNARIGFPISDNDYRVIESSLGIQLHEA